jgi:hypothetical protein
MSKRCFQQLWRWTSIALSVVVVFPSLTLAAATRFTSPNYSVESVIIGGTGVLRSAEASIPPVITEGPTAINIEPNKATIIWKTSKESNGTVRFGTESGHYITETGMLSDYSLMSHSVDLMQLQRGKLYYYRVRSTDINGNMVESEEHTFTTDMGDVTPPVFTSGPTAALTSGTTIVVTWETDELSNTLLEYGITAVDTYSVGRQDELTTFHQLSVSGLQPDQLYQWRAKSKDASGNLAVSKTQTINTLLSPSITDVRITDITLSSALIAWKTSIPTTSIVNYGQASATYTMNSTDTTESTLHTVHLVNLMSGQSYYLRLSGVDASGNKISSDEYVFQTVVLPVISDFKVSEVTANSVFVSWRSSSEIDELVRFDITDNADKTLIGKQDSKGSDILSTKHASTISGLESDSGYRIVVSGKDIYGNRAVSTTLEFHTLLDKEPPKIENIRTDTTVDLGSKSTVQVLVSFGLSKKGVSQIKYGPGASGDYTQSITNDTEYSVSKFVVIPGLTPGESYHFKIYAQDKVGNAAESADYLVLAPTQSLSLFDLIFGQIRSNFGWLGSVGK